MARPIVRDFLTGVVSLAGLAGLIVTLMMFGEFAGTGQKRYTITAYVANAGGLSDSSPVTLNGVRIGTVDRVSVRRDGTAGATLTLKVLDDAAIPRHAVAMIDKGIFGDAGLEFTVPPTPTPPTSSTPTPTDFIKPGETVDLGAPVSPLEHITKLVEEPLTRLANSMGNVEDLTRTYQQVGNNLNDLLEPRTQEQIAQGKAPNLRSTLDRADRAITSAQVWLDDDGLRADARETIARAKNLADELTKLSQAWTNTAKTADENLAQVATNAQELTTRASTALEQLSTKADATLTSAQSAATQIEQVAGRMNRGEGTLGQLSTNPDLYRSLTDAVQRLDRALVDLDALLVQFRTEGIPVDF